jgi:TnpA family transposase
MASLFLNQSQRERYEKVPAEISKYDLMQFFQLTQQDKIFLKSFRGEHNRLGIAFQIGIVRFMGFLPDRWQQQIPADVADMVSGQLSSDIELLSIYGQRDKTRTEHLNVVLKYLKFRRWQPLDEIWLSPWLLNKGMEHDNEPILLRQVCLKLGQEKILRPAIGTLERIVGSLDEQLHQETYRRLSLLLTEEMKIRLTQIVELDGTRGITLHRWLCQVPTSNTPRAINQTLEKINFLKSLHVHEWDLSVISLNRRKRLAQIARNVSNKYLQRMHDTRRYPILICFLYESLIDTNDKVLEMFDDYWEHIVNGSKKELDIYQQTLFKSQSEAMRTLSQAVTIIINDTITDDQLRTYIFEIYPKEMLREALLVTGSALRPAKQTYLYYLKNYYATLKQFTPNLLKTIGFQIAHSKDGFLNVLEILTDLQTGKRRKLPDDAPVDFITPSWSKLIFENDQQQPEIFPQRQPYELCALANLRDRLRAGDVFVDLSRKYADFNSLLLSNAQWGLLRADFCSQMSMPPAPTERIDQRLQELESLLKPLDELLNAGGQIRLEEGVLVVPALPAEDIPFSAKALREQINQRLPKVNITDIIKEVDAWVNFSEHLHGLENDPRNPQSQSLLYASVFASGCNIPLSDLARSCELDYQSLWWTSNNYLSEDNLKKANDTLINFHYRQWLSGYWGGGTLSSSDGQRFPTSGKIRNAKALPNYFGYGKGITFYTHTSDQYSQYGSRSISSTERDATYVLDEIIGNETDLTILEHTTDTSGYSDLIFALFDLLGMDFCPRIRDIKDQRLCKIKDREWEYPALKFTGRVNPDYLKQHFDELLKVAASIKSGRVTASLLISKLQSYPRQNNLMYVLQAYGQLVKTIFILKYLLSMPLRRKINTQLIKGEQLHNLRLYLWFGGDGVVRRKQEEQQQKVVRSLNLITNIVLVWNTVYTQEVIKQLYQEGCLIDENDFEFISPAPFAHINRLGKYSFNTNPNLEVNGLRSLRKPKLNT